MTSLVESLKKLKAIETTNLESLVKETVCSVDERECMYGNCNICKDMDVKLNIENQHEQTTWAQWKTTKVCNTFKNGDKKGNTYCCKGR